MGYEQGYRRVRAEGGHGLPPPGRLCSRTERAGINAAAAGDRDTAMTTGAHGRPGDSSRERPTIAFLTRTFRGYLASFSLWFGLADEARESDVNLIYVPGNPPQSTLGPESQSNVLYDLITRKRIDGIVVWSGVMMAHSPPDVFETFYRRFESFPRITIGPAIEGTTSFTIDNYHGMLGACSHLIERHGCRRIAFIRGPDSSEEAAKRYRGYRDALERAGLSADPSLELPGDFQRESGVQAVRTLLDERKAGFDALAGANDWMAFGAVEELRRRKVAVPEEVKVIGFDDVEESRYASVPISTVRQPFYEMGRRAIRHMLMLLSGGEENRTIEIPAEFVPRASCGCYGGEVSMGAGRNATPAAWTAGAYTREAGIGPLEKDSLISSIAAADVRFRAVIGPQAVGNIVAGFLEEFEGGREREGLFASALVRELKAVEIDSRAAAFYALLAALRDAMHNAVGGDSASVVRTETLLQRGHIAISDFAQRLTATVGFRRDMLNRTLRAISQQLMSRFDMREFLQALADGLPYLGIPACWFSLYDDPGGSSGTARLALACAGGNVLELDPEGVPFPATDIVPERFFPHSRRFVLILETVYFEDELMGYIVFEEGPREIGVYNALQVQLSVGLRGIRHARALEAASEELARSNRELERFAYIASHHLKEPLRKISIFAERLDTLLSPAAGERGRDYIQRLRKSARRMKALIEDLLVYSKTSAAAHPPGPVDLGALLFEIREDLDVRIEREKARIEMKALPVVTGESGHLYQLFASLILNALIYRHPERTPVIRISAAAASFRDRPAVAVTVADNGIGIEEKYCETIFHVFQKLDNQTAHEGTGMGLTLCRKIAAEHGGDVRVESAPGKGSRFIVTLPLERQA
ncbi:MAG: substrate-binding domain-containing protein [Spirochaetales bacterium]|nr:substrate-binding domain-containing protein [Spirochaetales bacterium]